MHTTAHLTPMHRWQHTPLGRTCAHVLVLLMALHGWPLWAQTLTWQPERYAPLWHGITWLLSPLDAQAMTPCDVDDNGIINGLDIQAIFTSQEDTAAADDPRDPDGDGVITVNDARACVLQCTEPSCVTLVPDVVGAVQANAEAALLAASLAVGTITDVFSGSVPAGEVISQDPTAGARVPVNTAVDLVVSVGPEPVTVPDVVGLFQGDAEAALLAVELTVGTITQVSSPTVPFGEVISQTPAAGTSALTGSAVDLDVSIATLPSGDLIRPAVQITLAAGSVGLNEPITITVSATDGGGIAATTVLINGTPVTLDANGMATFSSPTPGVFTVEATVLDTAGNEGFATAEFRVLTTGDITLPTVALSLPDDGAEVTLPTDIIGTADDTDLMRYVLELSEAGKNDFRVFASGTTPVVNAVLGQFDPTLLLNGIYDVRLTAEDTSGNVASVTRSYEVDGGAKIGNFTLSFNDLTIPVSGIPITITRTYDSRNRATGDFGAGWTLDIKNIELQESVPLGLHWEQAVSGGIFPTYRLEPTRPHFVIVRFPDGRLDVFDLVTNPNTQQLVPLSFTNTSFQADATTLSTLVSLDNNDNLLYSNGGGIGPLQLLQANLDLYDPDRYQLTDADGTVYIIQQPTGLESITDRNGNTVTFGPDGILHSAGKSVTFTRDAAGRITTITDPLGHTLRYTYDFYGDLVSVIDQESNVTLFKYNNQHGLVDIIDPRGVQAVRSEYDAEGRLEAVIDANGVRTEFTHDLANRREEILDRLGNTTVHEYDERGNITARTSPRGNRTTFTFDSRGNTLTETDPLGNTTTFTYDVQNNPLTLTDSLGNTTTFTYNAFGQVLSETDAKGRVRMNIYDADGNLTSTTDPDGNTMTYTYNAAGNPLTVTNAEGNTTNLQYDTAGNLIQITDPRGHVTTLGYDTNARRTSLTPPEQSVHTFVYNAIGLEKEYNPPVLGPGTPTVKTLLAYDEIRNLTRVTRPDGLTLDQSYDAASRLQTRTFTAPAPLPPDPRTIHLMYDSVGQIISVTAPDGGTVTHTYDASLRATSTWTGMVVGSVERTYDSLDRLESQSVNGSNVVNFSYDPRSLVTGAGALTLTRDPQDGLITSTTLGIVTDTFTYNNAGEVLTYQAVAGPITLIDTQYTRDSQGRIAQKTETIEEVTANFIYTYDESDRLEEVLQDGGVVATYAYDSNGNRLSLTTPSGMVSSNYDAQDRLLSSGTATYSYSANGELTSKTVGANTTTYAYDLLGNLLLVILPDGTQIDYVVDGENQRVGKKVNGTLLQEFLYQDRLNPIAELDGGGNVVSRFVYGSHEYIPDYMVKSGVTYRIISDNLGSPRLVVNTVDGTVLQRLDYDEFGNILLDTNPGFQPFGFAGGLYDLDTKLTRFGSRDYDAEIGRWTAKDPIRFRGGAPNLYVYVQNDPINLLDPTGLAGVAEFNARASVENIMRQVEWTARTTVGRAQHHIIPREIFLKVFPRLGRYFGPVNNSKNIIPVSEHFHIWLHSEFAYNPQMIAILESGASPQAAIRAAQVLLRRAVAEYAAEFPMMVAVL